MNLQPVVTARQRYQLQTALFRIDLDEFESALRRAAVLPDVDALAEYERAAALCRGDLIEGEPFPWLDACRADYRRRAAEGASRGAVIAARLGERERAALLYGGGMGGAAGGGRGRNSRIRRPLVRSMRSLPNGSCPPRGGVATGGGTVP